MKMKCPGQSCHEMSAIYGDQVKSEHRQSNEKVTFLLDHLKLLKPTFLHFHGNGFIPYSSFSNRFFIQQYENSSTPRKSSAAQFSPSFSFLASVVDCFLY